MAVYVVPFTLPYECAASRFAVYHSNSESLFTPVFHEDNELVAHMFACEFASSAFAGYALKDYSESSQRALETSLYAFLGECFPDYQRGSATLPQAWHAELVEDGYEYEDEPVFDASDLLDWYQDGDDRAEVAQRAFHAWRRAKVTA